MAVHISKPSTAPGTRADIRPLCGVRRGDAAFAGAKGAGLGELASAGFPVPDGFVVGTPARRDAAGQSDLPSALRQALVEAYEQLGNNVAVAVRSSETIDDAVARTLPSFSQVVGSDGVIDAVRRCWDAHPGASGSAVVVQRQIAAKRAGIVNTVVRATTAGRGVLVEAARGLGEGVVSGSVVPDRFVVDPTTLDLLQKQVHYKSTELGLNVGGTGVVAHTPVGDDAVRAALTAQEVAAVAALGLRVEQHYGSPQEVEWAMDHAGKIWILQTRPATTGAVTAAVDTRAG